MVRSVANGRSEWEGENHAALFVRDDECLVFYQFSEKDSVARDLASAFLSLFPHRIQVLKVHALLITGRFCFVFDVEEVACLSSRASPATNLEQLDLAISERANLCTPVRCRADYFTGAHQGNDKHAAVTVPPSQIHSRPGIHLFQSASPRHGPFVCR
jgi:hypothetical protein